MNIVDLLAQHVIFMLASEEEVVAEETEVINSKR